MNYLDKLAESGITSEIADKYKLKEIKNMREVDEFLPTASAIEIPYFDLQGNQLDFSRYRILKQGSIFAKRFDGKYYQKKDSKTYAYFPPSIDWQKISKDAGYDIIITEGEFKAIATAEAGYNCIGLGGVYSFQSYNNQESLIQGLSDIEWRDRTIYIIYDSDLITNIQVVKAQQRLAQVLYERGAKCWLGFISDVADGVKVGLDDLIVNYGAESVVRVLEKAKPYRMFTQLLDLSDKYLYSEKQDLIYNIEAGEYISVTAFHNTYSHKQITIEVPDKDGEMKKKKVSLSKEWMASPLRPTIYDTIFYPQNQNKIIKQDNLTYYNLYSGLSIKPEKNYKLSDMFLNLCYFIGRELRQSEMDFFIRWMASPLKQIGLRTNISTLVWSFQEGNGKSAIGEVLSGIYGKYSATITSYDLLSPYNSWITNKLFIKSDELFGQDGENVREIRRNMDILKNLITQTKATINGKYMKLREQETYCNYYFTSNSNNSIVASDKSRRFFVIHAPEERLDDKFYYEFFKEVNTLEGYSAILYYFLNEVKTFSDIEQELAELPESDQIDYYKELTFTAPQTQALEDMRVAGLSNIVIWLKELSESAKNKEPYENSGFSKNCIVPEIITIKDLLKAYNYLNEKNPISYYSLIKVLEGNNYKILKRNIKIDNNQNKAVILTNQQNWEKRSSERIEEYIKRWRAYMP